MTSTTRTAIITGASSGIGRALAVQLASSGMRVGLIARRHELLAEIVQQIRANGGLADARAADVGDRTALQTAIADLEKAHGATELLIANAGLGFPTGADQMNVDEVEQIMRVNFFGVVYAFEAVLPAMLARKSGRLAAISSLAAYKGLPGAAGYCASKAAVNVYLEALRIELYGRGVSVTTVCPGFVDTPMTANNPRPMPLLMSPDDAARRIVQALELRRGVFSFPWLMRLLMEFSRWAPDRFVKKRVPVSAANPNAPR